MHGPPRPRIALDGGVARTSGLTQESIATAVVARLEGRLMRIESQLDKLVQQESVGRLGETPSAVFRRTSLLSSTSSLALADAAQYPSNNLVSSPGTRADNHYEPLMLGESEEEQSSASEDGKDKGRWNLSSALGDFDFDKLVYSLQEPRRQGRFAEFVDSDGFSKLSFVVIVLNAAFIWYITNYMSLQRTFILPPYLHVIEAVFIFYYTFEIALRISVHRCYFLVNDDWAWNIFDLFIVVTGILEQLAMLTNLAAGFSVTFLRISRILRITKILRVFKAFRFLTELRLMAKCVLGSVVSLLWSSLFLLFVLMVSALFLAQTTIHFRLDDPSCPDADYCDDLRQKFGRVSYAMLSLFQATTGGADWGDLYDVVTRCGNVSSMFFIAYIIFFQFAFFNIITSMFVDKAMRLAKPDEEARIQDLQAEEAESEKLLLALIREVDDDDSGDISLEELRRALQKDDVLHRFGMLGIHVREVQSFFRSLTDISKKDKLCVEEFTHYCLGMRGQASAMDMQTMHYRLSELSKELKELRCIAGPGGL